ncbi:MAG: XrtA-associated ATPase [Chromatiaceae bacterium]|jgi:putative secretion ATPase (PEP-CTERM system associated)|nr:XrtA-associated ATPase [Chromatiaceae bacterium]
MYDEFYRLTGKPFQLTPDQRFFYESQVHNRAMAYLRYGLAQGEGFIVITGGIGTGKTMLVRNLFSEIENRDVMAAQLVTTQVGPEDMLRMVCASFGLAHEGMNKATLLHNLEAIARARFAEGKRILLVVDEAQNLPARSLEELRMLANFEIDGRSLFQSFLLGQDELRRTLKGAGMEQLRQRVIASHHLDPLSAEETRGYIEFRLGRVGWSGDPALDEALFPTVHELSGGVPRRINALCDRLFLYGCIEELHTLGPADLAAVAADMQKELALAASAPQPGTPPESVQEREAGPVEDRPAADGGVVAPPVDLSRRVAQLEAEVERLRRIVQHERKLLRKAVLIQLDLNGYDDLD